VLVPAQGDGLDRGRRAGTPASLHRSRHLAGRVRLNRRRLLLGALAVPLVGAAVLAVEVELARRGPDLAEREPLRLDGHVGGSPSAVHITWLGDSTAAGVGASSIEDALPRQVATALDRPVELTVLAVSGATVSDVRDEQVARVPAGTDLVVVDVGSNDVTHLTRSGDFRDRYEAVLARLPGSAAVVLLGVPDMGSVTRLAQPLRFVAGVRGGTLDRVVAEVARDRDLLYVDIAGETGPSFRADPGRYLAADRYHPSDAGYRLWADATIPLVRRALADR
jgi:lysophospholipase L1-like esterase